MTSAVPPAAAAPENAQETPAVPGSGPASGEAPVPGTAAGSGAPAGLGAPAGFEAPAGVGSAAGSGAPAGFAGPAVYGEAAATGGYVPPQVPPDSPYGPYAVYYAEPDKVSAFFGKVQRRTPRWVAPVALAIGCAAASAYVLWSNPTDGGAGEMPGCLLRLTTGFDCPGCGGTRAAWYLLHGDVAAAAQHHLIFVFALPFLLYAYASFAAGALFNKQLPKLRLSFRTLAIVLGVWAVFSVLRNLPFEPFSWFYV